MAGNGRRVLIVDDEPEVRAVLEDYLTEIGYEVLTAANGLEALWVVKHERPGAVLVDLAMPRLGGLDTIRHIRKFDQRVRLVVVTGTLTRETALELRELGVPIVLKPLDLGVVRDVLA
jgi:DNA-binding response OmpR family regulator